MNQADPLVFRYTFEPTGGVARVFTVHLDPRTLELVSTPPASLPAWTRLDFHQCANCPLKAVTHPHCPLAVATVDLADFFAALISYEEVTVSLETREREYRSTTSAQRGISSLLGIYMVTCGCPVLARLRPMVRFHLPFASLTETVYRAISMHLVGQFLRQRRGLTPAWDLSGLIQAYEQIQTVNQSFANRLRQIERHDAGANAVVILDSFAGYVALALEGPVLDSLEPLFAAYLEEAP